MKTIPLTKGQVAIVDDEDFVILSQWKWMALWSPSTKSFYAKRRSGKKQVFMHRVILGEIGPLLGEHINGNTLDNQRANLRASTNQQNCWNRKIQENNKSGFKGVCFHRASGKWIAQINKNRKRTHLGSFSSAQEAAIAYDNAAREYYGQFARLNQVNA